MTLKDLTYFATVNHTKVNKYQELVYNATTYNGFTFDLIDVAGKLMQLVGVDNTRVPFIINQSN